MSLSHHGKTCIQPTRRSTLVGVSLLAFGDRVASADPTDEAEPEFSDAQLDLLFEDNALSLSAERTRALTRAQRADIVGDIKSNKLTGEWAPAQWHTDYRHLNESFSDAVFALNHDVLSAAVRHNFFATADNINHADRIIFGLRGCEHADTVIAGASVNLREAIPDHSTRHCIIGVWTPADKQIATFRGSTTPNLLHMKAYAIDHGNGAGMMPTGAHKYAVGTHPRSMKDPHAPGEIVFGQQPGALLLASSTPVLRLADMQSPMCYRLDNAHLSWDTSDGNATLNMHGGDGDRPLDYSSAGCQTIGGFYNWQGPHNGEPYGDWKHFRSALGLSEMFVPRTAGGRQAQAGEEGKAFDYFLLTGRDARLFSKWVGDHGPAAMSPSMLRLRFGSSGAAVRALTGAMPGGGAHAARDRMDVAAFTRIVRYQQSTSRPDGIVTPDIAAHFGVHLDGFAI